MKRSTAIRHLVEMATEAGRQLDHASADFPWPLHELWVAGELLDGDGDVEFGAVVLLLDVAVRDLPWLGRHRAGEWVGDCLRLGKRPIGWSYRPAAWPAWNARNRRVLRIWSASDGVDDAAIEGLRSRGSGAGTPSAAYGVGIVEPTDAQLRDQLVEERRVARAHLSSTIDKFWDREWRRDRTRHQAEDDLWRASAAFIEIDDALRDLA